LSDVRYWSAQARRYDVAIRVLHRRFPAVARRVADDLRDRTAVLEVGAGTGLVTVEVARTVARFVATDLSPEMLAVLRERLTRAGFSNVQVREADALALPFEDGAFDGVILANLLHLLDDPGRALREARRVLRPRGRLCAPTFAHGEDRRARLLSHLAAWAGFPIVTRFGGDGLRRCIEAHGFRVQADELFAGLMPIRYVAADRV
jgi:ubiquinone/menaquinone biosynthesis C-methylase UbiE